MNKIEEKKIEQALICGIGFLVGFAFGLFFYRLFS